jgi:molecular chaperone DnaK (HSP70)
MADGVVVGVDFGTSFTVAALRRGSDPPRVIEVAGARRTPSVIFAEDDGSLVMGAAAESLTIGRPARGLRAAKQLLGRSASVVLGGEAHSVPSLIGGLLQQVLRHADREAHAASQLVFTHPADWTERHLAPFREALSAAGAEVPQLVAEPVAGAWAQAAGHGHRPGDHLVIYDLGGGTLDIAVLQMRPGGFEVVGTPTGNRALGGDLFDEVLMTHLGERHLQAATWEELQLSDDPAWTGSAVRLRAEVRRAKELLSLHRRADLTVSLPDHTFGVVLEREELVRLLAPIVEQSVQLCVDAVHTAGLTVEAIGAVHLIGGGSQLPSVAEAVGARFSRSSVVLAADPKAVVALGATLHPSSQPAAEPTYRAATRPVRRSFDAGAPSPVASPAMPAPPGPPGAAAAAAAHAEPSPPQAPAAPSQMAASRTTPPKATPSPAGASQPAAFRVHEGAQLGAQRRRALVVLMIALACITIAIMALVAVV